MAVRVALAGLGAAAKNIHLPALRKIDEVEVVGGFDPSATLDSIRNFETLDQLLEETRPDILSIATPPAHHLDIARAGLEAGCHIFCEKPLAQSLSLIHI